MVDRLETSPAKSRNSNGRGDQLTQMIKPQGMKGSLSQVSHVVSDNIRARRP